MLDTLHKLNEVIGGYMLLTARKVQSGSIQIEITLDPEQQKRFAARFGTEAKIVHVKQTQGRTAVLADGMEVYCEQPKTS